MIVIAIRLIFFKNQHKRSFKHEGARKRPTTASEANSAQHRHRYHIIAILVIDGHEQLGQTLAVCNTLTQAIDKAANQ
jgi:hypothetical protein